MRAVCVATFVAALAVTLQAQTFNFAEIPWGATPNQVKEALSKHGFTSFEPQKDGDYEFKGGSLLGEHAAGIALFGAGKLLKIVVVLITADHKAIEKYDELRSTLTAKYGEPTSVFKNFKKPYYDGDGYEEQAIRLGKATFATYWIPEERDPSSRAGALSLEITEHLTVKLGYESPDWGPESDRRKAKAHEVF